MLYPIPSLTPLTHKHRGFDYLLTRREVAALPRRSARSRTAATVSLFAPDSARINVMAEALNGTFKAELIEMQGPWKNFDQVERAISQWITWYNEEQLHSAVCEELDEEAGRGTVHVPGVARQAQLQVDRPPLLAVLRGATPPMTRSPRTVNTAAAGQRTRASPQPPAPERSGWPG